jgi:hypothetical protein
VKKWVSDLLISPASAARAERYLMTHDGSVADAVADIRAKGGVPEAVWVLRPDLPTLLERAIEGRRHKARGMGNSLICSEGPSRLRAWVAGGSYDVRARGPDGTPVSLSGAQIANLDLDIIHSRMLGGVVDYTEMEVRAAAVIQPRPDHRPRARPSQSDVNAWMLDYYQRARDHGEPAPKRTEQAFRDCAAAIEARDEQMREAMHHVPQALKRERGNRALNRAPELRAPAAR